MKSRSGTDNLPARPKGKIKNLRPLLRYLKPYRLQVIGAAIALVFASSAVLGMGAALRYLVDNGLSTGNLELLNQAFVMLLVVTVMLAAASYSRFFLVAWIGEKVVADIRSDAYRHLMSLHIGYFEKTRTGEILSRLTTDTTLIQTVIGGSISVAVRNTLLFFGGFGLLLFTSAKLTSYLFLVVPIVVLPIVIFGRKLRVQGKNAQERVADISSYAEETINAMRTIQSLTLEDYENHNFDKHIKYGLVTARNRIKTRAFLTGLVIFLVFGAISTVLWIGGHDVVSGKITGGQLSAFVFYSVVVAGAIGAISEVIADLQRAAGAGERLAELLAIEPEITSQNNTEQVIINDAEISFEAITFAYPTRLDSPSIKDFSLKVKKGETIAFVGQSGAGKTTIFQLLMRFYDPQMGVIRLNGLDVREIPLSVLRGAIGVVPQDPIIFSTTARENIRLGRVDATDAEIEDAARVASAYDFLAKLPNGLDTHLGEKGVQLSGGQRQRIAIARAIIRNPKILLLDEATSALDSENEYQIQQALEKLMEGRTTFVIAHRLSTITKADHIVLMNEGRIEAIGTHKELLEKSTLYARLAELQFREI